MRGVHHMTFHSSPVLAELGKPQALFDSPWLALLVILLGVAAFLLAVAAVGRWLAATHPDEPKPSTPVESVPTTSPSASAETPVEIFAAIAAAVAVTLGAKARVAAINAAPTEPVTESSRLQWSMEGRRQIYSSHKVR
jgi:cytoskeletal protein RodZ